MAPVASRLPVSSFRTRCVSHRSLPARASVRLQSTSSKSTAQPALMVHDVESWEEIEVPAPVPAPPAPIVASPNDLVFPLHSPLISLVLKQRLPHLREDHPLVQEALAATKHFEEKWHWHSLKPLAEPSWKQKKSKCLICFIFI